MPLGVITPECDDDDGAVLLPEPEVAFGPQSFIADWLFSVAPLPLLELGAFDAVLPGPQSVAWPIVLAPGVAAPGVLLVCAMAAVPKVKAAIDTIVNKRRFIRLSSFVPNTNGVRSMSEHALSKTAGCDALFRANR